jgi:hypothetical protein
MHMSTCSACDFGLDTDDNFCRRCGASAVLPKVPAIRAASLPTVWQPQVSPVVKGAAVMAAGTVGQFVLRRVVSGLLGTGTHKPRSIKIRRGGDRDGMVDEAQIITETIMMRRVRIRRQA